MVLWWPHLCVPCMSTFVERISAVVKVSPASARTIILMRALLILMSVKEADFARSLFGFAEAPITFRIESLFGLGIIFFLVTSTGEVPIGAVVADLMSP